MRPESRSRDPNLGLVQSGTVRGYNESSFIDDRRKTGGGALLEEDLSLEYRLKPVRDRVNAGLQHVAARRSRRCAHLNQAQICTEIRQGSDSTLISSQAI